MLKNAAMLDGCAGKVCRWMVVLQESSLLWEYLLRFGHFIVTDPKNMLLTNYSIQTSKRKGALNFLKVTAMQNRASRSL